MSTDRQGGRARLRQAGPLVITRVRPAAQVYAARAAVLFADLRGYTAMAERLPAVSVVPLLDEFLWILTAAAEAHGGTVFHVAGDAIMAGFGVNDERSSGAREALAAGNEMLQRFSPLAARWRRELDIEAGIGIGLHLGEVAVGVLGPPDRRTTTLVGDTVNVAARLCSRARAGEVLFSCTVAADFEGSAGANGTGLGAMPFLQLPQFALRGRRGPIDIWCVPALERLAL